MSKKITIHDITTDYLKTNGYDGLVSPSGECGCVIDDLFDCECDALEECCAGYKIQCRGNGEACDWHITTKKPESQIKYMKEKNV